VHFFYVATIAEEGADRRHVVFVGSTAEATITHVADLESRVTYSPSGHALFGQDGALLARPFDLRTYQFTGDPVSIAERLWYYKPTGLTQFAISDTGVLAYHGGPSVSAGGWIARGARSGQWDPAAMPRCEFAERTRSCGRRHRFTLDRRH
jgi:hypothetical protein